ncbi:MAG: hypothetical protein H6622_08040 [Halobacteriovoraceae bacterium]|nr:hypothetical protein [Halobacteriovoraceae bacterium]
MESLDRENKLILEVNFKFLLKDFKLRFITNKGRLIAFALVVTKVGIIIHQYLST